MQEELESLGARCGPVAPAPTAISCAFQNSCCGMHLPARSSGFWQDLLWPADTSREIRAEVQQNLSVSKPPTGDSAASPG